MTKTKKQEKKKNIPIRTCIATKVKKPKNELVKFVYNYDTEKVEVDLRNKIRGRGANLDTNEEAFDLMVKKKALPRALKFENDLSVEEYARLKKEFLDAVEEKNFRPTNKPVTIRIKKENLGSNS